MECPTLKQKKGGFLMEKATDRKELIAICSWLSGYPEVFYEKMSDIEIEKEYQTLLERKANR